MASTPPAPRVHRTDVFLNPDRSRVLIRPFFPSTGTGRALKIISRVLSLTEAEVKQNLGLVLQEFAERHQKSREFFRLRFEAVRHLLATDQEPSPERQQLIGAYFTQEYSLEAAALFNPSIVPHPDQSGLADGARRFLVSLRATGEGHISSITFRTGVIGPDLAISINEPTRFLTEATPIPNAVYEKPIFVRKLHELGLTGDFVQHVTAALEDSFTLEKLGHAIEKARESANDPAASAGINATALAILSLARSNYEIQFSPDQRYSERVIFPVSPSQSNGIEDARFVRFTDDDGSVQYLATYTAFDGKVIFPQLLETDDFLRFRFVTLNGAGVQNKGMALFPRKINGLYAMLSRQDNENILLMFSDHLHFWSSPEVILRPTFPWEYIQLGNCGSPIETDAGWLVLSHGVGPMRKYSIGAFLLDRDDPRKVIGRLAEPLLAPDANEREGYVPNVVYSCGAMIHGKHLVLPYAVSDYATRFALVELDSLLGALVPTGRH